MNNLRISENLLTLRRNKGITQDELATFLGVTKASVSKWETKQSYPDILLLPQIAAYFDVSIDELLGYEPQMSSEQIIKCYHELASDFAKRPFDEVIAKGRELVKKYYSCYPLIMQIVILWINHFMLTPDKEKQTEILKDIIKLCDHIREGCSNVSLCNDSIALKALANLIMGNASEVIEELQPLLEQKQFLNQSDMVLIQAYQMVGDHSHADLHSQVTVYNHLLNLICNSIGMIQYHIQDQDFCETTISRVKEIMNAYNLKHLHPDTALKFHYQSAYFYCFYNEKEKALDELTRFVHGSLQFIENGLELHGDNYFNRLDEWFEGFALKNELPRNKIVILDSLIPAMENPVLSVLFDTDEYKRLIQKINEKRKLSKKEN